MLSRLACYVSGLFTIVTQLLTLFFLLFCSLKLLLLQSEFPYF